MLEENTRPSRFYAKTHRRSKESWKTVNGKWTAFTVYSACLTSGHSKYFTISPNIHPFMHTFTHSHSDGSSGAVRVRCLAQGHLDAGADNWTSNLTSRPALPPGPHAAPRPSRLYTLSDCYADCMQNDQYMVSARWMKSPGRKSQINPVQTELNKPWCVALLGGVRPFPVFCLYSYICIIFYMI